MRNLTCAESKLKRLLEVLWEDNPIRWQFQKQVGPFYVDFAILGVKVAVELDGGYHLAATQLVRDADRTRYLEANGWRVMRFTNDQVMTDPLTVVRDISATFGLHL